MEVRHYAPILRRWSWLIAVVFVVSTVISMFVAENQTPTYESRARIIVGPTLSSQDTSFDILRSASQLVLTYRELVKTPPILDATLASLSLAETRAELSDRISVSSNDVTRLLSIRVRHEDPEIAARIANALAAVLISQNGSQQASDESQLTVVDAAEPGASPVSPNKPLIVILGIIAALLLAGAIIFVAELVQGQVKSEEDVRAIARAPSLGTYRLTSLDRHDDPYFASDGRDRPVQEPISLASRKLLGGSDASTTGRTVLVCAPGSTPIAAEVGAYLAAAVARSGMTTLVVDADMRRRGLSRFFGLSEGTGFASLVSDREPPAEPGPEGAESTRQLCIRLQTPSAIANLFVVPSGTSDPAGGAAPEHLRATIAALKCVPAVKVVSGPAMAEAADALVLAQAADSVVLVTVANDTRASELAAAVENLQLVGATDVWTLTVSLTMRDRWRRRTSRRNSPKPLLVESDMTLEAARRFPAAASASV